MNSTSQPNEKNAILLLLLVRADFCGEANLLIIHFRSFSIESSAVPHKKLLQINEDSAENFSWQTFQ